MQFEFHDCDRQCLEGARRGEHGLKWDVYLSTILSSINKLDNGIPSSRLKTLYLDINGTPTMLQRRPNIIGLGCSSVEHLTVAQSEGKPIEMTVLSNMLESFGNLKSLEFRGLRLSPVIIPKIELYCPQVEVHMVECRGVDDDDRFNCLMFEGMGKWLTKFQSMGGLREAEIRVMRSSCPKLKSLIITGPLGGPQMGLELESLLVAFKWNLTTLNIRLGPDSVRSFPAWEGLGKGLTHAES